MQEKYNQDKIEQEAQKSLPIGYRDNQKRFGHDRIIHKREGSYLTDIHGKSYLDANTNDGSHNLGHRPAEIVSEMKKAIYETDQGNFPIISEEKALLAEALANFVPGNLMCSNFSVMRGESIEYTCKLVRGFTKKSEFITFEGSYFGETGFALSLSDVSRKSMFEPLIPNVKFLPFGDLKAAQSSITSNTAGVFVEPIQVENNARTADKEFYQGLKEICVKTDSVLVFDETQTGMGRTGKKFAYEHFNVLPDVVIIGEALGSGVFPIAATITNMRINRFMEKHPLIHLSTFGGSDLGCRIAKKTLEIYERDKPWEHANAMGNLLKKGLEEILRSQGNIIQHAAGVGLLISLYFGSPEGSRYFCKQAAENGLMVTQGKVDLNSVVLRPPLTISEEEINEILRIIRISSTANQG